VATTKTNSISHESLGFLFNGISMILQENHEKAKSILLLGGKEELGPIRDLDGPRVTQPQR
jgi:hypothetical protein